MHDFPLRRYTAKESGVQGVASHAHLVVDATRLIPRVPPGPTAVYASLSTMSVNQGRVWWHTSPTRTLIGMRDPGQRHVSALERCYDNRVAPRTSRPRSDSPRVRTHRRCRVTMQPQRSPNTRGSI